MYADLYGNIQNYRIKSLQGNKVMAEIADEELRDITPKKQEVVSEQFQDIGYYTDEYGHKRFGIIPKQNNRTRVSWNLHDGNENITSNPRYR